MTELSEGAALGGSSLVEWPAGWPLWRRGKVRDVYALGDRLLMVASDRLSAFDVVLPTPVPGKGVVLTQLSLFWFDLLRDVVPHHVLCGTFEDFDPPLRAAGTWLRGRSMLVRRTEPLPVECVVRGYLAGSALKEYRERGSVCGLKLPRGLAEGSPLPEPLFTPTTKAATGHDQSIGFDELSALVGGVLAERLRAVSLELYRRAALHARSCGLLLADTKFEFGLDGRELVWIDEALTPDSSRFWPAAGQKPGPHQPSFDKQYVRDYLEACGWDKRPPGPELPAEVVRQTAVRYREALARLAAGTPWARWAEADEVQA